MREILFKAKRIGNGEWVEGYYVYVDYLDKHCIVNRIKNPHVEDFIVQMTEYDVDVKTICQYTGLTDNNGNKIWENDVVNVHVFHEIADGHGTHVKEKGVICYDKIGMLSVAVDITDGIPCYSDILFQVEIAGIGFDIEQIGNVFDNPELLERN